MKVNSGSGTLAQDEGRLISPLFCEELADVGECFEFESIACGIEQEHGCLLANFALEADVGFDDEGDACAAKAFSQSLPVLHGKHDAEEGHRGILAVDGHASCCI